MLSGSMILMKIISVLSIGPEGGLLVKFQSKFHLGTVSKKCSGKKNVSKRLILYALEV